MSDATTDSTADANAATVTDTDTGPSASGEPAIV